MTTKTNFTTNTCWFIRTVGFLLLTVAIFQSGCASNYAAKSTKKPHIVFLISEDPNNYEAHKTIPQFAEVLRRDHGYKVSVLLGEGERTAFRFPGLDVLPDADLLVVFARRLALSHQQMNLIKNYLKAGKPLVGIRTANHAFTLAGSEVPKAGYESWAGFVAEVLGCQNRGYGPTTLGTDVAAAPGQEAHPILKGVEPEQWHSIGNVYYVAPLLDQKATVLLTGKAGDKTEPIAWTRMADKSRVFYTSLGYPADFEVKQFQNLLINGINWALDN